MLVDYNGVLLPFVSTDRAEWEPVYQDGDYLYTRVTVAVTTVLTPDSPGFVRPGENPRDAFRRVQHALEQPRGRLLLLAGPQPDYTGVRAFPDPNALLDVAGADAPLAAAPAVVNPQANRDLANGPLPTAVRVVQTSGADTWVIQWGVVACVRQCDGLDIATAPKFLSNRWEESAAIDADFLTTRTRTGTLRIRPDIPLAPDSFRWVVCPPIPDGFTRERSEYKQTSDGLALAYTFVDVERPTMPPPPAVRAEGTFRIMTQKGAIFTAEANVRLTGDPRGSRRRLVATAFAVCLDRLRKAGPANRDFRGVPLTCMIEEDLYANKCQVSLRCNLPAAKPSVTQSGAAAAGIRSGLAAGITSAGGAGVLGLLFEQLFQRGSRAPALVPPPQTGPAGSPDLSVPKAFDLGGMGFGEKPLFSTETRGPDPGLRSTAGLRLAAVALNDPCLARTVNELTGYGVGPNRRDPAAGGATELRTAPSSGGVELRGQPRGQSRVGDRALAIDPSRADYTPGATVPVLAVIEQVAVLPDPVNDRSYGGAYSNYVLRVVYDGDTGMVGVPSTVAYAPAVGLPGETGYRPVRGDTFFCPVSSPTLGCVVEWSAERTGDPPAVPPFRVADPNVCPLTFTIEPGPTETDDTGVTLVYRASGRYRYGFRVPQAVTFGISLPPFLNELMFGPSVPLVFGPQVLTFNPLSPPPPPPPP